jgi:hypothetical protein
MPTEIVESRQIYRGFIALRLAALRHRRIDRAVSSPSGKRKVFGSAILP